MLKIINLTKENNNRVVLNKINLDIDDGDFVCLVGPTGSGKTALLRIIAGLENPDEGEILLKGENITKLPPYKRTVNTVFNSFSLFPHLDLYHNIEYGLNFKKISKEEKQRVVENAIDIFGLTSYLHDEVNNLDDLIKYKIALSRALVNNPTVLLLDDSLKLLENRDRLKMRYELKRLQKSLKKTFIYITDDLDNAFALADKMAIFQHGTMHQFDTPRNIYETPETYFVASYIGNMNFFYARILNSIDGHYKVELDDHITVNITGYNTYDSDRNILYAIRPERMKLSNTPETENQNITKGKIIQKDYQAEYTQYYVQLEYGKIIVVAELNYNLLLNNALSNFFEVGESVYIKWSVLAGDLVYA